MEGQSANGGTIDGGHRYHEGPTFDRLLYHTLKVLLLLFHYVSVNSKPDHPSPPPGIFERVNSPRHKENANLKAQGRKIVLQPLPRGNYFQESSKKTSTEMLICLKILKQRKCIKAIKLLGGWPLCIFKISQIILHSSVSQHKKFMTSK